MQWYGLRVLWSRFKAIRFMMADKTVPKRKKALILAGIIYIVVPIDLIPAFAFPFCLIDDVVVLLLILWYLRNELDKYWYGEKGKDLSKKFRGKQFVDDVEYEMESDRDEQVNDEEDNTDG